MASNSPREESLASMELLLASSQDQNDGNEVQTTEEDGRNEAHRADEEDDIMKFNHGSTHHYVIEFFVWIAVFFFAFGYSWASTPITYNQVALAVYFLLSLRCFHLSSKMLGSGAVFYQKLASVDGDQEKTWPRATRNSDSRAQPAVPETNFFLDYMLSPLPVGTEHIAGLMSCLVTWGSKLGWTDKNRNHLGYPGAWLALFFFGASTMIADVVIWYLMTDLERGGWGIIKTCEAHGYTLQPDWPWPFVRGFLWLMFYPAIGNLICESIFRLANLLKRLKQLRKLVGFGIQYNSKADIYMSLKQRVKGFKEGQFSAKQLHDQCETWINMFTNLNLAGKVMTPMAEQALLISLAIMAGNLSIALYSYFVQKNDCRCWGQMQFMMSLCSHMIIFAGYVVAMGFYCLRVNTGFDELAKELRYLRADLMVSYPSDDIRYEVLFLSQTIEAQLEVMNMEEARILLFGFKLDAPALAKIFSGLIPILVGAFSFVTFPKFPENSIGFVPGA
eukprot:TRINITY_DN49897_c0_g1_i1.p1 TRINITY_DN49897_c0_g1~~TRINITY_DN49897_c0_g1_i1.p1  ORF type:complete len:504 (-),score=78.92 TRINITY_DN49897_c0_g1_i1:135-1646(-)